MLGSSCRMAFIELQQESDMDVPRTLLSSSPSSSTGYNPHAFLLLVLGKKIYKLLLHVWQKGETPLSELSKHLLCL